MVTIDDMPTVRRFYGGFGSGTPTERQLNFLFKLAGERSVPTMGTCGEERIENFAARLENERPSRQMVSRWIDTLTSRPYDERERQPEPDKTDLATLTPGVYELKDGTVYVVKRSKQSQRLYAKRLVEIGGRRVTEADTVVRIDFEYEKGAIYRIKPDDRMALDRAEALAVRYGRCINCGRALKDAKSVRQGIGPVCIKAYR